MKQLSFQSENLIVDYISFKFQCLEDHTIIQIADYLLKIGFNSYQESGRLAKPIKEPIFLSPKNQFEVTFVRKGPYWHGTALHFSGSNAAFFYNLGQKGFISWEMFSSGILNRFDLCFSRNNKISDRISTQKFLENCQKELNQKHRNVSLEKNSKGFILRIGNRRSNNYFRIYQGKNFLKFEHEMKGKLLQHSHPLLVENCFEQFEQKLSSHFLLHAANLLPFHDSYMDWLVIKLRPIRKYSTLQSFLNTDYIESNALCLLNCPKKFVMFLQFLTYVQTLDSKIDFLGDTTYRKVRFRLDHFLKFKSPTLKSTNYYKLKKVRLFFEELQNRTFITSFSDIHFQRLAAIPKVQIFKSKKFKCWMASVWLVEDLFQYTYPFFIPDLFRRKMSKDEFDVTFEFIKTYSSVNVEKRFNVKEFLSSYRISNQRINYMKRFFIQLVKLFQAHDLIEPHYKVCHGGSYNSVQELTLHNIYEGFLIYEKLLI